MAPTPPKKINIRKSRRGTFTEKAKRAGMTVNQYARKVLKKGSRATAETKKQANFALNFGKIARKNKGKKRT